MSGGRGSPEAMAAVVAGVVTLLVVRFGVAGAYPWLDPALSGIIASAVAFFGVLAIRLSRIALASAEIDMKTHRIAVIAGDGIGKEVIPAGIEILNMAAEQGGFTLRVHADPVGMRLLPADRPHDGRRRRRAAAEVRRDLSRRDRRPARRRTTSRRAS